MIEVGKTPCSTCPYACSTPPGVWHESEYLKLLEYDKPTEEQPPGLFMCHTGDGATLLCSGWLAVHNRMPHSHSLLALRFAAFNGLDPELFNYDTHVELFASGSESAAHGMSGIDERTPLAIDKALRAKDRREDGTGRYTSTHRDHPTS